MTASLFVIVFLSKPF